jgi:two-component system, cell cycle sensor histidine kinase and response regulator CckA
LGKSRLLLVEDNLAVRNATRMLLSVEGYYVTEAASLSEALQRAREPQGIDLLLPDYYLDGETGVEVIAALRAALQAPLKVILITGDTDSVLRELPSDPDLRVTSKPIKAAEFLTLVQSLLAG